MLECWSVGVLECWSVGVLEGWSVGGLEGWRVECSRARSAFGFLNSWLLEFSDSYLLHSPVPGTQSVPICIKPKHPEPKR